MGFSEAVRTCLKLKYATFEGRAARSEYWYFYLFFLLVLLVLALLGLGLMAMIGDPNAYNSMFLYFSPSLIALLALFIPMLSVTIRRLHDRDMSGWWYLGFMVMGAIPYIGFIASIALLVITCLKGTNGPNRFGRDPLGAQHSADVFA